MRHIHIEGGRIIKSWCNEPGASAIQQAENLARLPFAFRQICLMPDTHMGYGMPIGGVLATESVVIPNAVGVDIGCGMCASKTSLTEISVEVLKWIMGRIRKRVPVGFNRHSEPQDVSLPGLRGSSPIVVREYEKARCQVGTLGGGNHFIEIQHGDDGHVWIMIHSGSRNLGKQVADTYNHIAIELNEKWHSRVPKEWQLAFLPLDSEDGQQYINEMQYCVDFAFTNRHLMLERIQEIFAEEMSCVFDEAINVAHNYARLENHFGKNVLVHRKGATSAKNGEFGIIPGSQGTSSYIVKGRGNPESFMSCSHGAGRVMGRKEAQRSLSLEAEQKRLDERGIIHGIRTAKDLDEAAGAYKPIETVMDEQRDLVEPIVKLEPLAVIKG